MLAGRRPRLSPRGPTAGLTDVQREAVLQWLGRRCAQQKATSFELLVRQVQAPHQQQPPHMGAVRTTRGFIEATGIVCGRPQPVWNLGEADIEQPTSLASLDWHTLRKCPDFHRLQLP